VSAGKGDLERIAGAAATHAWNVSVVASPRGVMATRESGRLGEPWVVMAVPSGGGLRLSLFQPGDALDAEGEELAALAGNPRAMGRELRSILEDLAAGVAA
jgi:hypothetical protein